MRRGSTGLRVGVLPTLPFHAGVSMQLYAAGLMESLAGVVGIAPTLLRPPFADRLRVGWVESRWMRYVRYPAWSAAQPADVYHVADHGNAPLLWRLPRARTVVTCHDLYPLALLRGDVHFPGAPARVRVLPTSMRLRALRRARMILAVSRHSGDECRRYLRIPSARIRVVFESIAPEFWAARDAAQIARIQTRLELRPDDLVVLHVGSNDARKNVASVCAVIGRLRARVGRSVRLVKVGAPLGPAELGALWRGGVPPETVRQVGRVSTEELVGIYQAASVLLYPSFHEGFCRPVVEAMAAGLPVVGSRAGAIPELAGEAAALYAPDDIEGMADGVVEIAGNPRMRKEMSDAGREASRLFSPEACGPRLAAAYREAAEG